MKEKLTQRIVNSIKPNSDKAIWITDAMTQNLRLYVGTSGKKVWYVRYLIDGKERTQKLGIASDALTVAQAREMANQLIARIAKGEDPKRRKMHNATLAEFLTDAYEPWAVAERKSGEQTVYLLRLAFQKFLDKPISDLNIRTMEKWRQDKMSAGIKAATCNRRLTALKAALNWAVKREYIEENPLAHLEKLQEHDSDAKVRYLSDDERTRLMATLDAREEKMRKERGSHNEWLAERGQPLMPTLADTYTDHIKPMVLFALNTGLRRGALFSLKWGDIDFNTRAMLLRAAISKSGKTERLPLNKTALTVLSSWRDQCADMMEDALVFPSPKTGKMLNNVKKAWAAILKGAQIENFRWHDMRHDFASQLVMKGVDLNTVRELMGHSDMKMTLRYAHLAPESKLRAVELLDDAVSLLTKKDT